ncbi:MAG: peptide-methionine (R)-S-oxide reductase MsrB [Alphaproteobacteria bacterium]|nr:peptide-methionine (R)-S-oxide reductase MsrB [Alphaproteobacteria bacterium]
MREKIRKTDAEWREQLDDASYYVTRLKGTEPPFSGEYTNTEDEGVYTCKCCGEPLFLSDAKYHSGCGWPSFFKPLNEEAIDEERDTTHGMVRTEILCSKCGAHLGHVFEDGPEPTGLRYCVNSLSLKLEK